MTNLYFQIRPCKLVFSNDVDECDFKDAEFFGVYFGKPGAMYHWADWPTYELALASAKDMAQQWGVDVDDVAARTKP